MKHITFTEYVMITAIILILSMMAHGTHRRIKLHTIEQHMKAGTSSYEERIYYKKYHRVPSP